MTKQRQKYIANIMANRYADDDPKNYDSNLAYLNTLSTEKLEAMSDFEDSFEVDFDDEILDTDFDNELDDSNFGFHIDY